MVEPPGANATILTPTQSFPCGCRGVWVATNQGPRIANLTVCGVHLPGRRVAPTPTDLSDVERLEHTINVETFENKILDVMAEFGDQPEQCLSIIGELIGQRQHFRAHPNAPRVD